MHKSQIHTKISKNIAIILFFTTLLFYSSDQVIRPLNTLKVSECEEFNISLDMFLDDYFKAIYSIGNDNQRR